MPAHDRPNPAQGDDLLPRLKGPPLSVLIALAGYGALGCEALAERTGWWSGAVAGALETLVELELVERLHYRAWSLCADLDVIKLLGLPAGSMSRPDETAAGHVSRETRAGQVTAFERWPDPVSPESRSRPDSQGEARSARPSGRDGHSGARAQARREPVSAPETGIERTSAPYDDDQPVTAQNDDLLAHQPPPQTTDNTDIPETQELLAVLRRLDPPFENARQWLRQTSPALVAAWLDHLQRMDGDRRRNIRNEAAYIRAKVSSGQPPPPNPRAGRRRPCAHCGKTVRDAHGRCLVCAGVVVT